ncbi:hypothetical protein KP509_24G077500 [Ceratopteris richardii]|nr:hypothetical protein KP509_24G077500 [Ceratopteris richardii]
MRRPFFDAQGGGALSVSTAGGRSPPSSPPTEHNNGGRGTEVSWNIEMIRHPVQFRATREQAISSLKESKPHARKLKDLQKSERQFQKDGSTHKKNIRRMSKDLYVVLGWYAILQSALFAAVAQTSVFKCDDKFAVATIAAMVAMGTLFGVRHKLSRMHNHQKLVLQFQARQNAVHDVIEQLYLRGSACDIASLQPNHDHNFEEDRHLFFLPLRNLLVFLFLISFTILVISSCNSLLCNTCPCK